MLKLPQKLTGLFLAGLMLTESLLSINTYAYNETIEVELGSSVLLNGFLINNQDKYNSYDEINNAYLQDVQDASSSNGKQGKGGSSGSTDADSWKWASWLNDNNAWKDPSAGKGGGNGGNDSSSNNQNSDIYNLFPRMPSSKKDIDGMLDKLKNGDPVFSQKTMKLSDFLDMIGKHNKEIKEKYGATDDSIKKRLKGSADAYDDILKDFEKALGGTNPFTNAPNKKLDPKEDMDDLFEDAEDTIKDTGIDDIADQKLAGLVKELQDQWDNDADELNSELLDKYLDALEKMYEQFMKNGGYSVITSEAVPAEELDNDLFFSGDKVYSRDGSPTDLTEFLSDQTGETVFIDENGKITTWQDVYAKDGEVNTKSLEALGYQPLSAYGGYDNFNEKQKKALEEAGLTFTDGKKTMTLSEAMDYYRKKSSTGKAIDGMDEKALKKLDSNPWLREELGEAFPFTNKPIYENNYDGMPFELLNDFQLDYPSYDSVSSDVKKYFSKKQYQEARDVAVILANSYDDLSPAMKEKYSKKEYEAIRKGDSAKKLATSVVQNAVFAMEKRNTGVWKSEKEMRDMFENMSCSKYMYYEDFAKLVEKHQEARASGKDFYLKYDDIKWAEGGIRNSKIGMRATYSNDGEEPSSTAYNTGHGGYCDKCKTFYTPDGFCHCKKFWDAQTEFDDDHNSKGLVNNVINWFTGKVSGDLVSYVDEEGKVRDQDGQVIQKAYSYKSADGSETWTTEDLTVNDLMMGSENHLYFDSQVGAYVDISMLDANTIKKTKDGVTSYYNKDTGKLVATPYANVKVSTVLTGKGDKKEGIKEYMRLCGRDLSEDALKLLDTALDNPNAYNIINFALARAGQPTISESDIDDYIKNAKTNGASKSVSAQTFDDFYDAEVALRKEKGSQLEDILNGDIPGTNGTKQLWAVDWDKRTKLEKTLGKEAMKGQLLSLGLPVNDDLEIVLDINHPNYLQYKQWMNRIGFKKKQMDLEDTNMFNLNRDTALDYLSRQKTMENLIASDKEQAANNKNAVEDKTAAGTRPPDDIGEDLEDSLEYMISALHESSLADTTKSKLAAIKRAEAEYANDAKKKLGNGKAKEAQALVEKFKKDAISEYKKNGQNPDLKKEAEKYNIPANPNVWTEKDALNAYKAMLEAYNKGIPSSNAFGDALRKGEDPSSLDAGIDLLIKLWPADKSLWTDGMHAFYNNLKGRNSDEAYMRTLKEMQENGVFDSNDPKEILRRMKEYSKMLKNGGVAEDMVTIYGTISDISVSKPVKSIEYTVAGNPSVTIKSLTDPSGFVPQTLNSFRWTATPIGEYEARRSFQLTHCYYTVSTSSIKMTLSAKMPDENVYEILSHEETVILEDQSGIKADRSELIVDNSNVLKIIVKAANIDMNKTDFYNTHRIK